MAVKDYLVIVSSPITINEKGWKLHTIGNLVVILMLNGLCKKINNSIDMNG